jgi:hypothetical protein
LDNPIGFLQNVVIPESEHAKAALLEPCGSSLIVFSGDHMLPTVDFYCESGLHAKEIEDVGPDWYLPTKSVTVDLTSLQSRPQPNFGSGHFPSEPSSSFGVRT